MCMEIFRTIPTLQPSDQDRLHYFNVQVTDGLDFLAFIKSRCKFRRKGDLTCVPVLIFPICSTVLLTYFSACVPPRHVQRDHTVISTISLIERTSGSFDGDMECPFLSTADAGAVILHPLNLSIDRQVSVNSGTELCPNRRSTSRSGDFTLSVQ